MSIFLLTAWLTLDQEKCAHFRKEENVKVFKI